MGKDLRGRELGEGLTQLKDGRYIGRYTNRFGKRKPIYGRNLREVKEKLVKAKYEDRHTFATMCLENGVNPKAVQFYMGHANITVTMDLYSHMTEDLAFDEIKKMTQVV